MTAPAAKAPRIGDLLLREGLVTQDQLNKALAEQRNNGSRVGYALVKLGFVKETDLTRMLARQHKMPAVDLTKFQVDPRIAKLIAGELALKHSVLPLKRDGRTLTVAMSDPASMSVLDDIKFITRLDIFPVIAGEFTLRNAIEKFYESGEAQMENLLSDLVDDDVEILESENENTADNGAALIDEAPVVKLINAIMTDALKKGASDIHFECFEKELRVRYRIDGALHEIMRPPIKMRPALISRFKIMASLNIAERRVPQDGRFKIVFESRPIDFRVSIIPSIFGEDAVLRVLDKKALTQMSGLRLDVLGFDHGIMTELRKLSSLPYGMLLVTGPTGSGKTTTLYGAISETQTGRDKIVTIEDPVEYQLPGVLQIPVNEKKGLTFARGLRSILRHDPDKIMVGEIRDPETAQIAIQSALTGHLVFTTVHANNVFDVVSRFVHMGVDTYSFVSALSGVLAQRLVRVICVQCCQAYLPSLKQLEDSGVSLAVTASYRFRKGQGCQHCRGTGYRGRKAVGELLVLNDEIREAIVNRAPVRQLKELAQQTGVRLLRASALDLVRSGQTTLEEVNRVTVMA